MPIAQREVLSVGIDVGTTTTQVVFSRLVLHDVARPGQVPRIQVDEKDVVHQGQVHLTPLRGPDEVDAEALAELVRAEYRAAGVTPGSIETGAVIITGETARTANAEAILAALSAAAGDFVVTIAGPNAESQIAGRGSGAARWSTDHYEQVTSVDIGGGTSNAAIFSMGRHLCSSAIAVGGRQIEVAPDGTVTRIAPPGRAILASLGIGLTVGARATLDQLTRFCEAMAAMVVDLVVGKPVAVPGVQLTAPLVGAEGSTSVFLTGGIGACFYDELPATTMAEVTRFGDVGPLLAAALHRDDRLRALTVRRPPETLRATVLGAAGQTVTLSGSTIWVDRALLPLRNLPVLRPAMPGRGGGPSFAQATHEALARWDLEPDAQAAIVVDLPSELGYPALQAIAAEIVAYHDAGGHTDRPLVLVLQQDYAQVLGQTLQATRPGLPLIAIDQVGLGEGDFIDIGSPVLDGRAVPLSIKTLVFYD